MYIGTILTRKFRLVVLEKSTESFWDPWIITVRVRIWIRDFIRVQQFVKDRVQTIIDRKWSFFLQGLLEGVLALLISNVSFDQVGQESAGIEKQDMVPVKLSFSLLKSFLIWVFEVKRL